LDFLDIIVYIKSSCSKIPVFGTDAYYQKTPVKPGAQEILMLITEERTEIPGSVFDEMLSTLESINNSFDPAFKELTPEQRKTKNAVALKRRGFIDIAHEIAMKNSSYTPGCFDYEEFDRNLSNVQRLSRIKNELKKVTEHVRNAELILNNDVYRKALSIHRYLREAMKSGMSGAKPLYLALKKQFPNGKGAVEAEIEGKAEKNA
jgi:hypothetical protein